MRIAGLIGYCCDWHRTCFWLKLTLIIYGSHLGLDCLTQSRTGLQLLWPLPGYYQSPIVLFPSVRHWEGWFHRSHLFFLAVETVYSLLLLRGLKIWLKLNLAKA